MDKPTILGFTIAAVLFVVYNANGFRRIDKKYDAYDREGGWNE